MNLASLDSNLTNHLSKISIKDSDLEKKIHLCANSNSTTHESTCVAQYFCLLEKVYLCEKCIVDHKPHEMHIYSIKNHLSNLYRQW